MPKVGILHDNLIHTRLTRVETLSNPKVKPIRSKNKEKQNFLLSLCNYDITPIHNYYTKCVGTNVSSKNWM